jgi:hypothetical protein
LVKYRGHVAFSGVAHGTSSNWNSRSSEAKSSGGIDHSSLALLNKTEGIVMGSRA